MLESRIAQAGGWSITRACPLLISGFRSEHSQYRTRWPTNSYREPKGTRTLSGATGGSTGSPILVGKAAGTRTIAAVHCRPFGFTRVQLCPGGSNSFGSQGVTQNGGPTCAKLLLGTCRSPSRMQCLSIIDSLLWQIQDSTSPSGLTVAMRNVPGDGSTA